MNVSLMRGLRARAVARMSEAGASRSWTHRGGLLRGDGLASEFDARVDGARTRLFVIFSDARAAYATPARL